jgi:hypothetical protein
MSSVVLTHDAWGMDQVGAGRNRAHAQRTKAETLVEAAPLSRTTWLPLTGALSEPKGRSYWRDTPMPPRSSRLCVNGQTRWFM